MLSVVVMATTVPDWSFRMIGAPAKSTSPESSLLLSSLMFPEIDSRMDRVGLDVPTLPGVVGVAVVVPGVGSPTTGALVGVAAAAGLDVRTTDGAAGLIEVGVGATKVAGQGHRQRAHWWDWQ